MQKQEPQNLAAKTSLTNKAGPLPPLAKLLYHVQTVPVLAEHVTAGCFVQVREEKTAVDSFMVSWALTLWGSPIQLCKSFSKHPATLLSP